MGSRTYNVLIIAFWISSLAWLVVTKVVPELRRGDPPNYLALERQHGLREPAVCWDIYLDSQLVGKAASKVFTDANGDAELRSRVELTDISLNRLRPSFFRMLLSSVFVESRPFALRIDSRIWLNRANRLRILEARAFIDDLNVPLLKIDGQVLDDRLLITYRVPTAISAVPPRGPWSIPWTDELSIDLASSPRGYMPPLRLHQSWKIRQFVPLQLPGASTDVIEATVERQEPIRWNDGPENCWLVVYRRDSGSGSEAADKSLGRMWVRIHDGLVLKQELMLLDTPLRFERLSTLKAKTLSDRLEQDWMAPIGDPRVPRIDAKRQSTGALAP